MEKATVNMKNWKLRTRGEDYSLSGNADRHPRLGNNTYIGCTSYLVSYTLEDDILTYETRNTIYICPLKYMVEADEGSKASILKEYYESPELTEHLNELMMIGQKEREEEKKKYEEHLLEVAKGYEDCIYIEMKRIADGDMLAYHIGGKAGLVEPHKHISDRQDSILYMRYQEDDEEASLDFRYWPMEDPDDIPVFVMNDEGEFVELPRERKVKEKQEVVTYSWSDNIKRAVIKNDSHILIEINGVDIAIGETKVFGADRHVEGLLSPDCYNGKSCLTPGEKRND